MEDETAWQKRQSESRFPRYEKTGLALANSSPQTLRSLPASGSQVSKAAQRALEQSLPNRFWVTDIACISIAKGMVSMCAVMNLCGKMVLAYRIGHDMASSLVTDTIRDAMLKEKVADGLALHSDRGPQYTSQAYVNLSEEYHFQPSMPRSGCPYGNAPMEHFFGTLKTERLYRMNFSCRAGVGQAVAEYVLFYNFERVNLKNGFTPFEIRSKPAESFAFL